MQTLVSYHCFIIVIYSIAFRILNVDEWDNGNITFDLIACLNLLDRCDKPVSVLHSIKKVLKPGGHVVVAIVLPFSPYVEFGMNLDFFICNHTVKFLLTRPHQAVDKI